MIRIFYVFHILMLFMKECEIALIDVILIKVQLDTFIYSDGTVTNTKL